MRKKIFTLLLAMAIAFAGHAQVKSISKNSVPLVPATAPKAVTGFEPGVAGFASSNHHSAPGNREEEPIEIGQSYYDWQSNMGARNVVAVWPDGFAAMAWTISRITSYTDSGTGIATFDPAEGEWTYSEGRVENERTSFGTIARYKENGLVVAAHTSSYVALYINEDFRNGGEWGNPIVLENGSHNACWATVQCSGENLDIIHILYTDNGATEPYTDPLLYARYANGAWETTHEVLPALTADKISYGGSNIAYFMQYDPEKPNRVAFILNSAWSDGKAVVSDDNGATWDERVFYQHPNINGDFTDETFLYPRWTSAAFDNDDNLHVVYDYNGTTGTAGSDTYYPEIGGIGYWSEVLPKNPMCVGGIGDVGQPFVMNSTYIMQDLYRSEWYWDEPNHDPLPEYIGEMELLDAETYEVVPRDYSGDWFWPSTSSWGAHGTYANGGKAQWATMFMDGNRIFAFWSQICGEEDYYTFHDGENYYLRLFCNISFDGGLTWEGTKHVLTDYMTSYYEMAYNYVIPYVYEDENGEYLWVCSQMDEEPSTYVQDDETVYDNNFYKAVKVYVDFMGEWDPEVYTIAATANPSDGGTVYGGGDYDSGSTPTLEAVANIGYGFVNWTVGGNEVSTNPTLSFKVNSDVTFVANFEKQQVCELYNGETFVAKYATIEDAIEASAGDRIVMISNSQENVTFPANSAYTLNLNGHVLKGTGTGSVVTVNANASLTLSDSDPEVTHYYTVGGDGLWTWIASPTAVQISGATAYESLTARPAENDIIAVKGGAITGGSLTSGNGAGINSAGALTIFGGNIIGNSSANYGGGVYFNGSMNLAVTAKIIGNTNGMTDNNLYLPDGKTITVLSKTTSTTSANIGVTTHTAPTLETQIAITGSNSADYSEYFKSDVATYYIANTGSGDEQVVKLFAYEILEGELETKTYGGRYLIGNTGAYVPGGVTANLTGQIDNSTAANFTIKDGGQLITTQTKLNATVEKSITAAQNWSSVENAEGWYTISSPVRNITTANVNEMLTGGYDLFRYNEPTHFWINNKNEDDGWNDIEAGRGYLYAAETTRTLGFADELNSGSPVYNLTYTSALDKLNGFNLIGNPYTQNITLSNITLSKGEFAGEGYYILTNNGSWVAKETTDEIAPCTGFLVQVSDNTTATFSKTAASKGDVKHASIAIRVANNEFEDMAYALFSEGDGLNKISHRNADAPMLYITQNGTDYAIATMSESTTVFPLSFKAATTGYYTISLKSSQIYEGYNDFDYLHLIDNMTGNDIDMQLKGEYRFIGSPADNADRFTVVLHRDGVEENVYEYENFVYQNGNELVINGEGTLQIFDMLGRVVINEEFHGGRISTSGLTTGAYIVRIISNEIKTQKIIIR